MSFFGSVYLCAVSAYVFGLASDLRESAEMASLSNSPLDRRHRPASLLVSRSRFLEFRLQFFDGGAIPLPAIAANPEVKCRLLCHSC